ncbi:MAG: nuclear transport factor 2 family protein [Rhodocyclaceae bacterium]
MPGRRPFFATPQDAESAFYDAIERADLEAMMSVWAEDEEIVCVHPGGPRLSGFARVREAWRVTFTGGPRLRIRLSDALRVQGPLYAVHSVHENIMVAGEGAMRVPVIATNVYLRTAIGWRMLSHHASPAPPGPEVVAASPHTLH